MPSYPETLGALKRSPFGAPDRATRSVKDEMRQNLLARLAGGGPLFAGVIARWSQRATHLRDHVRARFIHSWG